MPKLIVVSDSKGQCDGEVTLEEYVLPAQIETEHSAAQLIERVGWAIRDAADAEGDRSGEQLRAA
jgi:hypothetical protein